MSNIESQNKKIELGDFQTPRTLTDNVCDYLYKTGLKPSSIIEPTCGTGNFIISAIKKFGSAKRILGLDINTQYINKLQNQIKHFETFNKILVKQGDFFNTDWKNVINDLPEPILFLGNPPWVTNSKISLLNGTNLPQKNNINNYSGFEAITGKSNFDISEWMIIHLLEISQNKNVSIAMLCKTTIARKVIFYAWKKSYSIIDPKIIRINSKKSFGVSVDACLLTFNTTPTDIPEKKCEVFPNLDSTTPSSVFGFHNRKLIANINYFNSYKHLLGNGYYKWRSGIKHDSATIMELNKVQTGYQNRLGEIHDLENTYIYPLLKSSDLANHNVNSPSRYMIVTQKFIGEDTNLIKNIAPSTWNYLSQYEEYLSKRKSSIYKNKPRFSIFGVGKYSFSEYKVAISGLYKKLDFIVVGSFKGKPIVLDDTCYFISCHSLDEATFIASLLNSDIAKKFFQSFIFWDAKRPITIEILNRLNIQALSRELNQERQLINFISNDGNSVNLPLF